MVFRSLVVLHVWLHSCLCFSLLKKNCFKSLLDTSSTPGYLSSFQAFSYCNLDTSSTPSGSIEKVPISSIAYRQLGRSIEFLFLIWWFVPRHMLDTSICRRPFSRHLPQQISRHLHLSRFTDGLNILLVWSASHFCRSLSQYLCLFISQTSRTQS